MLTTSPNYIIAIGASAGGLEELNAFFDHTPLDHAAYVIVQHLSPDFKSRMVELIARHSKLSVQEAQNGMLVKSNEVYLIPSNKFMTICNGILFLTFKEKNKGPHLTINRFFNSLAADCGSKAIGVILSGMGSDGTEGVKAIKKAGGMVIARDPETSSFASMPSHAIATGLVDFILEPEAMPEAIIDYTQYAGKLITESRQDENIVPAITELISQQLPLDFSGYKQGTILRRIKRRAAFNQFTRLENYLEFLQGSPEEVAALAGDFLISVTAFFRDKDAFEYLQKEILPGIIQKHPPGEELKMWVAGCATGEEAYSLAILLCELLTAENKQEEITVKIFATDVDNVALVHAGKGVYPSAIEKDVSEERLKKYFLKEGEYYRVKPALRKMVIFAHHDLVKNPPYCNMALISCRNLLIYMTPVLQKKIFSMLLFGLKADGYLFLGSSENPLPILHQLEVAHKKHKIYRNLETKRTVNLDAFSLPDLLERKPTVDSSVITDTYPAGKRPFVLSDAVNTALSEVIGFLAVCINERGQVIKTYGDTTKYLLQKNFNPHLSELLPRPLEIAFNALRTTVLKTNQKVVVSGIKVSQGDSLSKISIAVSPVKADTAEQGMLMVTFFEEKQIPADSLQENSFDEKLYLNQYTRNLEEQVGELKEKLHNAGEKLDATNENMQSFNEELLSANEEMQSTNEEMQSVNEELHTINADYQLKNKELLELNDDLNNYFRSNINGQLFVNTDLLLLKFSPGAVKLINLRETDIGRPLSNISTNIKLETLTEDLKRVLSEGCVLTREIQTNDGKWYQCMTMPYLEQLDSRIKGAILTFNEITELKLVQLELNTKNDSLLRINEDLDHFAHAASHDLLGPLGNIEASISAMNRKSTDPELDKYLQIINLSVKKFSTLIKDLAFVAKIESGGVAVERIALGELLDNIEWSLENKISSSGALITRDLQVNEVLFSKKNFRSILYNLLSNAIKFRRDEPPIIHICAWEQQGQMMLSIRDNGKGIKKEGLNRIFELYGRLNQNTEGQGVGLYLAKKLVDSAGGRITVESEPGKGSTFTIYLKAAVAHQEQLMAV